MLSAQSFHDFKATDINGKLIDMSTFKGKKLLIVNTASKCGYTPQYKDLQDLYEKYGSEKFEIIGFPANNFREQEPGSNKEIAKFCQENFGVTFTMMSKISVKGEDIHDIYKWLTKKSENAVKDAEIKWNFQKFMIDENGNFVDVVMTQIKPQESIIIKWLEE